MKRFNFFKQYLSSLEISKIRILDLGGTSQFWELSGLKNDSDINIFLLNLYKQKTSARNIHSIKGNALNLKLYSINSYDVIFSNSLIEHFGSTRKQKIFADSVRRIGKHYFIQTPNKYFPIEPHFLLPFVFLYPQKNRTFLIRVFSPKWYIKIIPRSQIKQFIGSIKPLSRNELTELFPEGKIYEEKIFGLTKSIIIYN